MSAEQADQDIPLYLADRLLLEELLLLLAELDLDPDRLTDFEFFRFFFFPCLPALAVDGVTEWVGDPTGTGATSLLTESAYIRIVPPVHFAPL